MNAAPTKQELQQLKAADPTAASAANFLQLQTEQLLEEVAVDYGKFAAVGVALHALKACFDALPAQHVTASCVAMAGLPVRHFLKEVSLPFAPPARLDIVGSYTLRHGISLGGPVVVDVAVEMPASCFLPKDILNYRYHDKRNLYLGVLAGALQALEFDGGRASVRAASFHGDAAKPILVLQLPKKVKGAAVHIHIYPVVAADCFDAAKLNPGRSNLRQGESPMPTPRYSNAVLEDMRVVAHLKALHAVAAQSPAFVQACMLVKVWLRQRNVQMNGFQGTMVLLYLVQTKKIHLTTAPDAMFKIWLHFIATLNLRTPLVFPADGDVVPTAAALEAFAAAFDVVLLDASNRLNLLASLSAAGAAEVQWLAQQSAAWLGRGTLEAFQRVFIQHHSVWARYDEYVTVPLPADWTVLETTPDTAWADRVARLAAEALGNRVARVRAITPALSSWSLSQSRVLPAAVTLGLSLVPEHAQRVVDKGPDAEDSAAAATFRAFWKSKAELRRFKDGAIVETVVWDDVKPHEIVGAIVDYIVHAHHPCTGRITSSNATLLEPDADPAAFATHVPALHKAWNALGATLRSLDDVLPLKVKDAQPLSPAFRYTSAQPPRPHPLASTSPVSVGAKFISTVVDPVVVLLQFESSSSWPTTAAALAKAKLGFYVHLAHALESHRSGDYACHAFDEGVDVAAAGFVFRLVLLTERDRALAPCLARQYGAAHATQLHALQGRHPSFAPTVRFARAWLESQLCGALISHEATELLVAALFVSAEAPPLSLLSGFTRFLHLLAAHPWADEPLVVDLQQAWTDADHREARKRFDASASQPATHPGLFIAASYEAMTDLSSWTRAAVHADERALVQRLVALARATSAAWLNWLRSGGVPHGWQACFGHVMDYDVVLHLDTDALPPPKLHCASKGPFGMAYYKNMRPDASALFIGFDPLADVVRVLQERLADFALVFANREVIALRWKPTAFLPARFRVMKATHLLPLADDSGAAVPAIFSLLREVQQMTHGIVARTELKT
ncbi:nucleolar protein 6 [Achlya hypogyna]|uniref:Nucleolar protein 6 n=1 Tax=Achlya hypogyna TaxID=1202772 RepID=A0A1V9YR72_ACHHY|nr:nucleolar protein 6 [Achlya hypogyna]